MVKGVRISRSFDAFCPVCGTEVNVELSEESGGDDPGSWSGSAECVVCGALVTLTDHRGHKEVAELADVNHDQISGEGAGIEVGIDVTTEG